MSEAVTIDAETGEILARGPVDLDAVSARDLTDRIKVAIEGSWLLVKQAYEQRAWVSLGYVSWDEYCTREFGSSRLRLPAEERDEVVASLRSSGLSVRAIAAATGIGVGTVSRSLSGVPSGTPDDEPVERCGDCDRVAEKCLCEKFDRSARYPDSITGTDGKTYPSSPSPAVEAARARRAAEAAEKEDNVNTGTRGVRHDHHSAEALRESIVDLAAKGYTSKQIGAALNKGDGYIRERAKEFGVAIPADAITGRSRLLDSDRIVTEMSHMLAGSAISVGLVVLGDLDPAQIDDWATSVSDSLRTLNKFSKQLKEMTQ